MRVGNRLDLLITLSWITFKIPIQNFYRYAVIGSSPSQINEQVWVSSLKFESTLKIIIKSILHFYHVPRWILSRVRPFWIPHPPNSVIIIYLVDIIITHHYLSTSRRTPLSSLSLLSLIFIKKKNAVDTSAFLPFNNFLADISSFRLGGKNSLFKIHTYQCYSPYIPDSPFLHSFHSFALESKLFRNFINSLKVFQWGSFRFVGRMNIELRLTALVISLVPYDMILNSSAIFYGELVLRGLDTCVYLQLPFIHSFIFTYNRSGLFNRRFI